MRQLPLIYWLCLGAWCTVAGCNQSKFPEMTLRQVDVVHDSRADISLPSNPAILREDVDDRLLIPVDPLICPLPTWIGVS